MNNEIENKKNKRILFKICLVIGIIISILLVIECFRYLIYYPPYWYDKVDTLLISSGIYLLIAILGIALWLMSKKKAMIFSIVLFCIAFMISTITLISMQSNISIVKSMKQIEQNEMAELEEENDDFFEEIDDWDDEIAEFKRDNNTQTELYDKPDVSHEGKNSTKQSSPDLRGKTIYIRIETDTGITLYGMFENFFTSNQTFYIGMDTGDEIVLEKTEKFGMGITQNAYEADLFDSGFRWGIFFSTLSQPEIGEKLSDGVIKIVDYDTSMKFESYRIDKFNYL